MGPTMEALWDVYLQPRPMALAMLAAAAATFVTLMIGPTAPYGRYSTPRGWGPLIPSRLAWVTQELPSFAVPAGWLALATTRAQRAALLARAPTNAALLAAYLAHYAYRDLVYPLRTRGGKPTPAAVWAAALLFCAANGLMQARALLEGPPAAGGDLGAPRFVAGMAAWAAGWAINLHSDALLIALRRARGDGGYRVPRGGAFDALGVSAANYTGEILEWAGWAAAAGSLPAAAFAAFTFANLAPRGWRHHQWYRARFGARYPPRRRAVIPLLW